MSDNSIKGIALNKVALTPSNLAFTEKLEKFNCAIVLDELGNDTHSKAALCIYDALCEKEEPNILIVTTEKLMYGWYRNLVTGLGVDFKFITAAKKGIAYFSDVMPNLYIMSDKALLNADNSEIISDIERSGIVWDLVVIDGGLSKTGFDPEPYIGVFRNKAEKLAMFLPCLKSGKDTVKKLLEIPAALLSDSAKTEMVKQSSADKSMLDFTTDSVFMRYYNDMDYSAEPPKVTMLSYTMGKTVLKCQDDLVKRSMYNLGGNIFEELTLEQRKTYVLPRYNDDSVQTLRTADAKLDAFLVKLDEIIADETNTVVTYFGSEKTLEYIVKVLTAKFPDFNRKVAIRKASVFNTSSTLEKFSCEEKTPPRIILAMDGLDERFDEYETITHVINYEYPVSPAILQHRYRRLGCRTDSAPEFILFTDTDGRFDGRMLGKVVCMNILGCFSYGLPSKSIVLSIPELAKIMSDLASALIEARDIANDAHFAGFLKDFNARYNQNFLSYDEYKTFVDERLDGMMKAFEFSGKEDKATMKILFDSKLTELCKGFVYMEDDGSLKSYTTNMQNNTNYIQFCAKIGQNKFVCDLTAAKNELRSRFDQQTDYVYIHDLLDELNNDDIRSAVLFNMWRYLADSYGIRKPYKEFIRLVNEGVI